MPKPYSRDLRERVVRAVEAGASRHEAAATFEVGSVRQSGGLHAGGRPDWWPPNRWAASARHSMPTSYGCYS